MSPTVQAAGGGSIEQRDVEVREHRGFSQTTLHLGSQEPVVPADARDLHKHAGKRESPGR